MSAILGTRVYFWCRRQLQRYTPGDFLQMILWLVHGDIRLKGHGRAATRDTPGSRLSARHCVQYVFTVDRHFLMPQASDLAPLSRVYLQRWSLLQVLSGIIMSMRSNIMGNATTTSSPGQQTKHPTEEICVRGPTQKWDSGEGLVNHMILPCCSTVTETGKTLVGHKQLPKGYSGEILQQFVW